MYSRDGSGIEINKVVETAPLPHNHPYICIHVAVQEIFQQILLCSHSCRDGYVGAVLSLFMTFIPQSRLHSLFTFYYLFVSLFESRIIIVCAGCPCSLEGLLDWITELHNSIVITISARYRKTKTISFPWCIHSPLSVSCELPGTRGLLFFLWSVVSHFVPDQSAPPPFHKKHISKLTSQQG